MSKLVVGATWDDVPHLSPEQKAELWGSIPPYQRDARSKGIPQLGSGAIYPVPESEIVVDPFGARRHPEGVDFRAGGCVGATVGVDVFDAQRQRVGEPPAGRGVGGGLHGMGGPGRVQRVEQHRAGAVLGGRPLDEVAEVAEITDAPGAGRP